MIEQLCRPLLGNGRSPLALKNNFIWSVLGNVSQVGCQWAMVVAIAKLASPESLGEFVFATSLAGPAVQFATLQLRAVQVVESDDRHKFGHFFALRTITLPLVLIAVCLFLFLGQLTLSTSFLVLSLYGLKSIESLSDVVHGLLQRRERLDRVAVLQFLTNFLLLSAFASSLAITGNLLAAAIAMVITRIATAFAFEWPAARWAEENSGYQLRPAYEWSVLWRLGWLALPLTIARLFSSLQTYLPRYFVLFHEGDASLGIFAGMAYFVVAGNIITGALVQASVPTLARHFHSCDYYQFRRVFYHALAPCLGVGVFAIAIAFLAGPQILTLVYTAEYAQYEKAFLWIIVAMAVKLTTTLLFSTLRVTGDFRRLAILRGFSAAVLTMLLMTLVPTYGIRGAAISTLLSGLVDLVTHGIMMQKCMAYLRRSSRLVTLEPAITKDNR